MPSPSPFQIMNIYRGELPANIYAGLWSQIMLTTHWFIAKSPSAGEVQDRHHPGNVKLLKHGAHIPEQPDKGSALIQLGWLLQKPFSPLLLVLVGQTQPVMLKPRLSPGPGAASWRSNSCSRTPEHKKCSTAVPGAASTHRPLSHPPGLCQQLQLDRLELTLHSGIFASHSGSCKMQRSDKKLVWQAAISNPPAFISAMTSHIKVMQLPDHKHCVWELLPSLSFYPACVGLDCGW